MSEEVKKSRSIIALLVMVIIGLIAGGVGELLTRTYLLDSAYNIPLLGDINYSDTNRSNLVIQQANKVVVQQNDKVIETTNSVLGSLVGFYKKKPPFNADKFDLANYYDQAELQGQGLIITSDGWVVINSNLLADNQSISDYVAVANDKKVYSIDQLIADKTLGVYYLHIVASDLPVLKLASQADVSNGQVALVVSLKNSTLVTSIINAQSSTSTINFSDSYDEQIDLSQKIDKSAGVALFDLAGQVIGIINEAGKTLPIGQFNGAIAGLLKSKSIIRPSFGAYFANMQDLTQIEPLTTKLPLNNNGALLVKNQNGPAVVKGSSADLAGLKEGDLILTVNDSELDQTYSLTDATLARQPGDSINLTFLRDGIKKTAVAKLQVKK